MKARFLTQWITISEEKKSLHNKSRVSTLSF